MATTVHTNVRIPAPLRERLALVAAAESRSLGAVIVSLLDRGLVERAREQALVERLFEEYEQEAA